MNRPKYEEERKKFPFFNSKNFLYRSNVFPPFQNPRWVPQALRTEGPIEDNLVSTLGFVKHFLPEGNIG